MPLTQPTPISSKIAYDLLKVTFLPVKIAMDPIRFVAEKIARIVQTFWGYFLTTGIFPAGSSNTSWFKNQIIKLYGGGCYDTQERAPFDPGRLQKAREVLENLGGISSMTTTKDGLALDTMLLRYQDVKAMIEGHGGQITTLPISIQSTKELKKEKVKHITCTEERSLIGKAGTLINPITYFKLVRTALKECGQIKSHVETAKKNWEICAQEKTYFEMAKNFFALYRKKSSPTEYVDVILESSKPNPAWQAFYRKTLLSLGMERATITLTNGKTVKALVIKHWKTSNPKRPKENQCWIRCNAPTESYAMAKRDILRHVLTTRGDMLCFDHRGTGKSQGHPSEGGYYLDAEAMAEKATKEYGYKWKDIWAEGFCLGSAIATHLFRKFAHLGINLFTENGFNSFRKTLGKQIFPASILGPMCMGEVRSYDPRVQGLVNQDGFNTVGKFEELAGHRFPGAIVLFNTDTDTTVPPESNADLYNAAKDLSSHVTAYMVDHPDKTKNGHSYDILSIRKVWDTAVELVANRYPAPRSFFASLLG